MNNRQLFLVLVVALIVIEAAACRLIAKGQGMKAVPEPVRIYKEMRGAVLTLEPEKHGLGRTKERPNVWGVVMEIGFPEAAVTMVSLADGTTSLYIGNGGGIIGGGGQQVIAEATKSLVGKAEGYTGKLSRATAFPLPEVGRVRFYVLTFSGVLTGEADEQELGNGNHALSPLYISGQEVLTQLRRWEESRKK